MDAYLMVICSLDNTHDSKSTKQAEPDAKLTSVKYTRPDHLIANRSIRSSGFIFCLKKYWGVNRFIIGYRRHFWRIRFTFLVSCFIFLVS
jgi:hypothetical protein